MILIESIFLATALMAPLPQGCGHHRPSPDGPGGHDGHGQTEPDRPRARAVNKICPVMGQPVKPGRDREVVVRGNYYLVCCDGCGPEMAERPDKYLDRDGRPRNAPRDADGSRNREPGAPAQPDHSEHQH